jgi:putative heme-binding domain-containing protein
MFVSRSVGASVWMALLLPIVVNAAPTSRPIWTGSHVVGSPEPPPPYQLERVYPKLTFAQPLDMTFAPGSNLRFVAEQGGKIYSFPDDPQNDKRNVFFDAGQLPHLKDIPGFSGFNSFFGFAFPPNFQKSHQVFVCYLLSIDPKFDIAHALRVSRFQVIGGTGPADPMHCDMASEQIILSYYGAGHCGGCLKFGPDGDLYISTGDGGDPTPPDPFRTGQDISDLLASILRIDVIHTEPGKLYSVPSDNPFVKTPGARGEVWAYGLRNAWRFSFDKLTGQLWAGDVGWETWESICRIEKAGNYGWSIMEGPGPVYPDGKRGPTPLIPPALYLSHAEACCVIGGCVYRGTRLPELAGQYIFGDWETRRLWAAPLTEKGLGKHRLLTQTNQRIVDFGEDRNGELYILDYEAGGIYRLVPRPPQNAVAPFPRKLSQTGLFASTSQDQPAIGVVPFMVNAEQWVDGATAEHWAAIPASSGIHIGADGKQAFPANSVLTRTLSLPMRAGDPTSFRRIETQMLHFDGTRWNAYTYRWNDSQSDADLVDATGEDVPLAIHDAAPSAAVHEQSWHFASRAQCMICHNSWADFTLAFNLPQLARPGPEKGMHYDSSVAALYDTPPPPPAKALVNPFDGSADLNLRARSYLSANCSHCHRMGGGGSANIDLDFSLENPQTRAIGATPTQGTFNIDNSRVIAPGAPSRSILLYRMSKTGSGHMPHMGSNEIDPRGLELIAEWIGALTPLADQQMIVDLAAKEHAIAALLMQAHAIATEQQQQVDALLATPSGALELSRTLDHVDPALRLQIASRAYTNPDPQIRDLFARFIPPSQRIKTLGTSFKSQDILTLGGDANRGRQVFAITNGGLCNKCHRVGTDGANFGPDLSHIGTKFTRAQLLENIVEPSKTIADGFAATLIKIKHAPPQLGIIISRTDSQIVLRTGPGVEVKIPVNTVDKMTPQSTSMMPEGLLGGLTAQQAADLLEYLVSLK